MHVRQVIFLSRFQYHCVACIFLNSCDFSTREKMSRIRSFLHGTRSRQRHWRRQLQRIAIFVFPSGVLTQQGFCSEDKGRYLLLRTAYFCGIYFMQDMKTRRYLAKAGTSSNIFISFPTCADLLPGMFKSATEFLQKDEGATLITQYIARIYIYVCMLTNSNLEMTGVINDDGDFGRVNSFSGRRHLYDRAA